MKRPRALPASLQIVLAAWTVLLPGRAIGYDHHLNDDQVREAYFVGQGSDHGAQFIAQYQRSLPVPSKGAQVAQIELSTPYAQVVEASQQHSVDYSAQDAAADYRKRGDSIVVRVQLMFTPTYTGDETSWQDVPIGLIQQGKHMAASAVSGQPIYSGDPLGGEFVIGAYVFATFQISGVKSDAVQVEVIPPGGPTVHAGFDLRQLM